MEMEKMKAKMRTGLVELYEKLLPGEIEAQGNIEGQKTIEFLNSIDGKEVELVFTASDAFEKNDNNVFLPDELWDKI